MPKRTNEFQRIVKYIYSQVAPTGGKVTESAFIQETGGGAQREIDILIEHKIAGHDIKIAVECRDHRRGQDLVWIDGLIGKYKNLKVSQIVAVSSSSFSSEAKRKAAYENIDLITVNEALTTDWIKRIEAWKVMTHSFTLMRIISLDAAGNTITLTNIGPDGKETTHQDETSEYFYNAVYPFFMNHLKDRVSDILKAKISENWQHYIDDPTPRWAEFIITKPGITRYGKAMDIDKLVFVVGTFFHVGSPTNHFALKEHALSGMKMKDYTVRIITDQQGLLLNFDVS